MTVKSHGGTVSQFGRKFSVLTKNCMKGDRMTKGFPDLRAPFWPPFQTRKTVWQPYEGIKLQHERTRKYIFGRLVYDVAEIVNPDTGARTPVAHDWKP